MGADRGCARGDRHGRASGAGGAQQESVLHRPRHPDGRGRTRRRFRQRGEQRRGDGRFALWATPDSRDRSPRDRLHHPDGDQSELLSAGRRCQHRCQDGASRPIRADGEHLRREADGSRRTKGGAAQQWRGGRQGQPAGTGQRTPASRAQRHQFHRQHRRQGHLQRKSRRRGHGRLQRQHPDQDRRRRRRVCLPEHA